MAVGVCDAAGSLLGAITVDDVLDRTLAHRLASAASQQLTRSRRTGSRIGTSAGGVATGGRSSDPPQDLTSPRQARRLGVHYDPDAFGQFSETIARNLGTARFLVWQTVIIVVWIGFNASSPSRPSSTRDRGLVLLTLVLSMQAGYAAPLILLAQNRQE